MQSPLIDSPEALDAAIATAVQTRREKLLHIADAARRKALRELQELMT
jgi:hypothetical protein